jgi:hypothetical protein
VPARTLVAGLRTAARDDQQERRFSALLLDETGSLQHAARHAADSSFIETAMKEGLLGGRLSVSPKSESKEARC